MPELRTYLLGERQLRPESDGKFGMGLNVMDEFYTSDAHSNGQLIQSGPRNLMETFHFVEKSQTDFVIPEAKLNQDGLKDIAQGGPEAISLHQANNRFMFGLLEAHYDAGVPVTSWVFPGVLNAFTVGQHTQINFVSEVIFGLMLKVNPLNQPGVQAYKEAAFKLLGLRGRPLRDQSLIRAKQQNIPL
jgi:glucose-6-phosphate isomerase